MEKQLFRVGTLSGEIWYISLDCLQMEETRLWEEGRVEIDLSARTFSFDVYWRMDKDEFLEEYGEEEYEELTECPDDFELESIPFSEYEKLKNWVETHPSGMLMPNGDVVRWIS